MAEYYIIKHDSVNFHTDEIQISSFVFIPRGQKKYKP